MRNEARVGAWSVILLAFMGLNACIRKTPSAPAMDISLYSGVSQLARLGDSETIVRSRANALKLKPDETDTSTNPTLKSLRISLMLVFPTAGLRVYFRDGHVALIEAQEPFNGRIIGRDLKLFPFTSASRASSTEKTWDEIIQREFGSPVNELTGGRLGSQALFYSWGDISFNGMGPNQLAIYNDTSIERYRESNFGRIISIFQK